MVQITVDFSPEENRKIGIVRGQYNLPSKEAAVKKIVSGYEINIDKKDEGPDTEQDERAPDNTNSLHGSQI